MDDDRFPAVAVHVALVLLGAALGVWGAFLIPLRLPGGILGLSVVIALVGNLGGGLAAAWFTGLLPAAAMPGIGWLVAAVTALGYVAPADEVVIPGSVGNDPAIGTVGTLFLFVGLLGSVLAVVLAQRFTRGRGTPTTHG